MKKLFLLLIVWLPCALAYAQTRTVKGKITDENGRPLSGVTVAVKNRSGGQTISSESGTYEIRVPNPATDSLVFTHIGYTIKQVRVGNAEVLDQVLQTAATNLDDVVVVSALGLTRKKNSVTYSSQTVDVDRLSEVRDVNIANGLAGKVAGLQVTNTGQPGSSSRIVIRGEGSISGNNQPLWVVDGVPIANNTTERNNLDYGNTAADLNPDDIESIEVLKGPNAAALYGSMASSGAILVTTKKGRPGDKSLGVSFNQNLLWYTISEFPAYQNVYGEGSGGRLVTNTGHLAPGTGAVNMGSNERSWGAPMLGQPFNDFSGQPLPGGYSPQPGNVTDFYKTSLTSTSNISISKSDASSSMRVSYTYQKSDDVLENQNKRDKHNLSFNASRKFGNKVTMEARVLFTKDDLKNRTPRNLSNNSPMAAYVFMSRSINLEGLDPWKDVYGNAFASGWVENPYWMLYENSNEDSRTRYITGITTSVDISRSLKLRAQATGDLGDFKSYEYRELGSRQSRDGAYNNRMQQEQNWNYEVMLRFNKPLSSDITLSANAATNLATYNTTTRDAFIDRLLVHDMPSVSNSNAVPRVSEALVRRQVYSVYGNATLSYKNLLYFDVTGRNDWSTTLPKGNNSYFYPSFGGSFVFSNLIGDKSVLSHGKLRVSWAKVGNSAPVYSLYNTWANVGLFLSNPTFQYSSRLNNKDLKPEQTVSREIGIDFSLFQQRASFGVTLYQSNSTNQIINANIPTETGFNQRVVNAGEMQNKGIEVTANLNVIKKANFNWNVLVNWSKNDNEVVSLVDGVPILQLGSNLGITVNAVPGMPYGVLMGNIPYYVGDTMLVQTNGRIYFETNKYVGVYRPDWIGSIGSSFRYKAFDLSFLVSFKHGGSLYSASYGRANTQGNTFETLAGRDEWIFSNLILGENDDERRGVGQQVGSSRVPYQDSRPKGGQYAMSYFPLLNASGQIVYDKNGRMIPGQPNTYWVDPQNIGSDYTLNNTKFITYDASAIRLSEVVLGYNVPSRFFKAQLIKGARVSLVGRNLWLIERHTPRGIDPESANTSGNAQGIESGGSFPYAQYGIDIKFNF